MIEKSCPFFVYKIFYNVILGLGLGIQFHHFFLSHFKNGLALISVAIVESGP